MEVVRSPGVSRGRRGGVGRRQESRAAGGRRREHTLGAPTPFQGAHWRAQATSPGLARVFQLPALLEASPPPSRALTLARRRAASGAGLCSPGLAHGVTRAMPWVKWTDWGSVDRKKEVWERGGVGACCIGQACGDGGASGWKCLGAAGQTEQRLVTGRVSTSSCSSSPSWHTGALSHASSCPRHLSTVLDSECSLS